MPNARDHAKASGDVHPPEVENTDGLDDAGNDTPLARELQDESRPGKGENQAGFLKDKDAAGGNEGKGD